MLIRLLPVTVHAVSLVSNRDPSGPLFSAEQPLSSPTALLANPTLTKQPNGNATHAKALTRTDSGLSLTSLILLLIAFATALFANVVSATNKSKLDQRSNAQAPRWNPNVDVQTWQSPTELARLQAQWCTTANAALRHHLSLFNNYLSVIVMDQNANAEMPLTVLVALISQLWLYLEHNALLISHLHWTTAHALSSLTQPEFVTAETIQEALTISTITWLPLTHSAHALTTQSVEETSLTAHAVLTILSLSQLTPNNVSQVYLLLSNNVNARALLISKKFAIALTLQQTQWLIHFHLSLINAVVKTPPTLLETVHAASTNGTTPTPFCPNALPQTNKQIALAHQPPF